MRNFLISLISIFLILSIWLCFSLFSAQKTSECITVSEKLITVSIPKGDWETAENDFLQLQRSWKQYQKVAYYFLDAKEINEIDGIMNKSQLYIEARDVSNSNGELSYLKEKINNLHQSDRLIPKNIM